MDSFEQPVDIALGPGARAAISAVPSPGAYARGLQGYLRELDQQGCGPIIVSLLLLLLLLLEEGLGLANANRLCRAAGPRPSR